MFRCCRSRTHQRLHNYLSSTPHPEIQLQVAAQMAVEWMMRSPNPLFVQWWPTCETFSDIKHDFLVHHISRRSLHALMVSVMMHSKRKIAESTFPTLA